MAQLVISRPLPLVSVVVLNWNRKALTVRCLASLKRQTFGNVQILLVDNGSVDGSVDFIASRFPDVEVVALPQNVGFAAGNNAGIQKARGTYVALLNNDAEAHVQWLDSLVVALESHPEVGFCASKMVLYDHRELLDTAGDHYTIAGTGGKTGHLGAADKRAYNTPRKVFGACAGAAIYRRALLDDVGLFDEDFFIAQEDVDLSFRAQLKGYGCLYVPTAMVYHHLNATLQTYSRDYVYYGHRNLEYVYLKNMPLALLLLSLPLHAVDVGLSCLFFVFKGKGGAFLKAKWDVLLALPHLLQKRRTIQKTKTAPQLSLWCLLEKRWLRLKIANLIKKT